MRNVFAFPAIGREETVVALDRCGSAHDGGWTVDGVLYVEIDDEQAGTLYSDWLYKDVKSVERAIGYVPDWAVVIEVSGRVNGTREVVRLLEVLLERGGVAVDDYSSHAWQLPEILSGTSVDGVKFFDPEG